jgi:hypothetical protein
MLRRHWPFALVLAAGALLRLACEIAYRPALFYSDSWGYLSMAHGGSLVSFAPLRPSGYPLLLKILHWLTLTTVVQHLAGLATATLVYATCRALGVRRWLATVAGALIALDAWSIALEQYILAEAFFGLALMLAVWATLTTKRSALAWGLGFAGLCLAAAALMRPVGLFAVPAWIIWLIWIRPGARPVVAGLACLVVPLLAYSVAHQHTTGTFGLTQANGWFLYGRVGEIATCDGIHVTGAERKLCKRPPQAAHENQSYFIFNRHSPARQAFGGISADHTKQAHSNAALEKFARQVIENHPGAYARIVARDFFKYLRPGPHALHREDTTVEFAHSARIPRRFDDPAIRHRLYPGLHPHASAPAGALRAYGKVVHTSRILVALITLAGLVALGLGIARGDPLTPALFLALGTGLGLLLGAALGAGFALRYLVPAVPELALAGALSAEALGSASGRLRRRRAHAGGQRDAAGDHQDREELRDRQPQ